MSETACTITGLAELTAGVTALPVRLRAASRAVAAAAAGRIQADAKARLLWYMKTNRHALADAIVITEDAANRQFTVESNAPAGQVEMLPVWVEYGTVREEARPYMGPAAAAESPRYASEMEAAMVAVVTETLG